MAAGSGIQFVAPVYGIGVPQVTGGACIPIGDALAYSAAAWGRPGAVTLSMNGLYPDQSYIWDGGANYFYFTSCDAGSSSSSGSGGSAAPSDAEQIAAINALFGSALALCAVIWASKQVIRLLLDWRATPRGGDA